MDHLQGFPFFNPAYNEGTRIDVYLANPGTGWLPKLMEAPHFPVPFGALAADVRFHQINGQFWLGEVEAQSYPLNHPGGSIAYRLEYKGKVLVYLTDHEPYGGAKDQGVRDFTREADLLIREAQYTSGEYEQKRGWGHSRFEDAVADAVAAGVKKLALFHHDPQHDDQFLERELSDLQARYASSPLEISLAREGQSIALL
jgi:phosphoribosyl 1,2-cyclic phosphodiesterase